MVAAVATKEDVAAQAFLLLGEPPIASFDEDLTGVVANTYERIVLAALSGPYKWRFATQKDQLGQDPTAPKSEWTYAYNLPTDRLVYVDAVFNQSSPGAAPLTGEFFEIFGQQLYTDETKIWIDYRVRPVEAQWPPYFAQLMVYACAAEWAETITEDEDKAILWARTAWGAPEEGGQGGYSRTARSADSRGGGAQKVEHFSLITARLGSGF